MAKLEIKQVNKIFETKKNRKLKVLDDISFTVADNEFAVIVGPSGCGKSTLLNIIAGLDTASEGEVLMDGKRIEGPGAERGMVFQSYTLFPWLSVQKNIEFGLQIKKMTKQEREDRAKQFLDLVQLSKFGDVYPKELSGGMKQRVAIARALANDPEILLMDEPFGALDAQTRVVMQELLLEIWNGSQKTVVFITHDIDEAILLADNIYIMSRLPGRIKEVLHVDIPRPRSHKSSYTPEFLKLKTRITESIWEESKAAATEIRK